MRTLEYTTGLVDMAIADYKANQYNKDIELNGVTYMRPSDEWICQLWFPESAEKHTFETVSFHTGTPLIEIQRLIHEAMESIECFKPTGQP